ARLRDLYPKVTISLHQATPAEVARMVIDEVADIGMATESLADYPDLVTLPCYEWQHVLVMPTGHPLAQKERITLDDIAHESLITYHPSFTGRGKIDQAFATRRLRPRIVLEAIDSDVIKTYVRLGLGIGIVHQRWGQLGTWGSSSAPCWSSAAWPCSSPGWRAGARSVTGSPTRRPRH
ncbi:LysR substrate-binding domain-containing protein, partial [Bifidobacterium longum]|nr:LysR substrate-binding domain-containing protein [Bifidobacterium longum]